MARNTTDDLARTARAGGQKVQAAQGQEIAARESALNRQTSGQMQLGQMLQREGEREDQQAFQAEQAGLQRDFQSERQEDQQAFQAEQAGMDREMRSEQFAQQQENTARQMEQRDRQINADIAERKKMIEMRKAEMDMRKQEMDKRWSFEQKELNLKRNIAAAKTAEARQEAMQEHRRYLDKRRDHYSGHRGKLMERLDKIAMGDADMDIMDAFVTSSLARGNEQFREMLQQAKDGDGQALAQVKEAIDEEIMSSYIMEAAEIGEVNISPRYINHPIAKEYFGYMALQQAGANRDHINALAALQGDPDALREYKRSLGTPQERERELAQAAARALMEARTFRARQQNAQRFGADPGMQQDPVQRSQQIRSPVLDHIRSGGGR